MFDHILVRSMKDSHTEILDLGALVEAMLFYGTVSLVITTESAAQLFRAWGPAGVLELIRRDYLSLVIEDDTTGVRTENTGTGREHYAPVTFRLTGKTGHNISMAERIISTDALKPFVYSVNEARKLAVNIRASTVHLDADGQMIQRVEGQFRDPLYTRGLIADVLRHVAPNYALPGEIVFDLDRMPDKMFRLRTNIDFVAAQQDYASRFPIEHSSLTPSLVLAFAVEARQLLETGAVLGADRKFAFALAAHSFIG